jgi:hypothetical protein
MAMSGDDYDTLQAYIQTVLRRYRDKECDFSEASLDIMHPLTAWDKGNEQEFVPYMKMMMSKWSAGDAEGS